MNIKKVEIKGIGGIKDLTLEFHEGLNLICGTNGVGKTTILDCISNIFVQNRPNVKKNVSSDQGKFSMELNIDDSEVKTLEYLVSEFEPENTKDFINIASRYSRNILVFKSSRTLEYTKLENIGRDPEKPESKTANEAYIGINAIDIKNWFIQRYMWAAHKDKLSEQQIKNLEMAKECFNSLDEDVMFSRVIPDTFDIMVNTKQGEVYFEYLSSGYKSCVYILLGIIKEIEWRYKKPHILVEDFSDIILIDEIDVHLHPQWESALVNALKKLVPKAQIIATTHSPSMIQCANPNEIIPLAFDENNNVVLREVNSSKYGFQGWTIEEILVDVMGMKNTKSGLYNETIKAYDIALDYENFEEAKKHYKILEEMLHPNNPIKKILKIQMAGIGDELN